MIAIDPNSLGSASIYQIFTRNFTNEGTLDAAARRLPELRELGFDFIYLTPVHPIGRLNRKGSLGSPYAISDYRSIDPDLGGEVALGRFIAATHEAGLGVILDIVYNHTSPDSILVREHPEWFWKAADGKPGPRVADWSDVVDLDYSHRELWNYQIETLELWARLGADGFRCDVASMVPLEFWIEARRRLRAVKPILWLAESVHKEFVRDMRRKGVPMASDPELHAAFDISYDYDGREELEAAWRGERSLGYYLKMIEVQESLYPAGATKLRFLENHDQERAAARFGRGERLRNWTVFAMLLPGTFLAYMGQEWALDTRIGLFEREVQDRGKGNAAFRDFFAAAHKLTKKIRSETRKCDIRQLGEGVILLERSGPSSSYLALLNLDGRSGKISLPADLELSGETLMGACADSSGSCVALARGPLILRRGRVPA